MTTFVHDFADGNKDQKDLLGGKGANLAGGGGPAYTESGR